KDSHHFRVIQSLKFTLEINDKTIRKFDVFRKKRNISEYDRAGSVSIAEFDEMIALAEFLYKSASSWMKKNHADLI
ncbi:MAG TPA: hypothetical protein PKI53_12575, partial [Candidatus Aminicenantes bacterium]|nr:hypothetical protein [Candidatus Aminicenantes bacterium]HQF98395.1 hypothetical protein [Candidatus Aminicenantes bacterium]